MDGCRKEICLFDEGFYWKCCHNFETDLLLKVIILCWNTYISNKTCHRRLFDPYPNLKPLDNGQLCLEQLKNATHSYILSLNRKKNKKLQFRKKCHL